MLSKVYFLCEGDATKEGIKSKCAEYFLTSDMTTIAKEIEVFTAVLGYAKYCLENSSNCNPDVLISKRSHKLLSRAQASQRDTFTRMNSDSDDDSTLKGAKLSKVSHVVSELVGPSLGASLASGYNALGALLSNKK